MTAADVWWYDSISESHEALLKLTPVLCEVAYSKDCYVRDDVNDADRLMDACMMIGWG